MYPYALMTFVNVLSSYSAKHTALNYPCRTSAASFRVVVKLVFVYMHCLACNPGTVVIASCRCPCILEREPFFTLTCSIVATPSFLPYCLTYLTNVLQKAESSSCHVPLGSRNRMNLFVFISCMYAHDMLA